MITRSSRATAVALMILACAAGAWHSAAEPVPGPAPLLSTGFDQYADGGDGGFTMLHQRVYVAGDVVAERVGDVLPAELGLDAVDVERDGGVLFSTEADGLVPFPGGMIQISHARVYRLAPEDGSITAIDDWSARGIEIDSLDALDRLPDGRIAFSTAHYRFIVHADGSMTLRPENAYLYDPATGRIELLIDGAELGLSDLDALHVLGPGVTMVSLAADRHVIAPSGELHLRHQDVYLVDGDSVEPWFDGARAGIQSIDALTLPGAKASEGLLLIPRDPRAVLDERSPEATAEYFVSLTRRPTSSTTIDLFSPDGQLGCSPDRIGFTVFDWRLPWTVQVHAIDDTLPEATRHRGTLTHTAVDGDARLTAAELPVMRFEILDDDRPRDASPRDAVGPSVELPRDLDRTRRADEPRIRRPHRGQDRIGGR